MKYWRYESEDDVTIWEIDDSTRTERCVYDSGYPNPYEKGQWVRAANIHIETERSEEELYGIKVTELAEDDAFLEFL